MGSGRQRKKKRGHRPSRPKQAPERLRILCDQHIERAIRELINRLPGYRAFAVQQYGLDEAKDWGALKAKAVELRAVILTRDADFLDPSRFPPGEAPGVVRIGLSYAPREYLPRLEAFFRAPQYWKLCKGAIVQLIGDDAFVQSRRRGEIRRIPYYVRDADPET